MAQGRVDQPTIPRALANHDQRLRALEASPGGARGIIFNFDNEGGYLDITTNDVDGSGRGFSLTDFSGGGILFTSESGGDIALNQQHAGSAITLSAGGNPVVTVGAKHDGTTVGWVVIESGTSNPTPYGGEVYGIEIFDAEDNAILIDTDSALDIQPVGNGPVTFGKNGAGTPDVDFYPQDFSIYDGSPTLMFQILAQAATPSATFYVPIALEGPTGATAATRYAGATSSGAPGSGTFATGDFVIDQSGTVWICTAGGSPGTWAQPPGTGGTGTISDITSIDLSVTIGSPSGPTTDLSVADSPAVGGITVTGTPTIGQVLTATSSSAADWETPTGGSGIMFDTANSGTYLDITTTGDDGTQGILLHDTGSGVPGITLTSDNGEVAITGGNGVSLYDNGASGFGANVYSDHGDTTIYSGVLAYLQSGDNYVYAEAGTGVILYVGAGEIGQVALYEAAAYFQVTDHSSNVLLWLADGVTIAPTEGQVLTGHLGAPATWEDPGAGGSVSVTDGVTTVSPATEIDFTSGATVTDAGGGVAQVAISGGSGIEYAVDNSGTWLSVLTTDYDVSTGYAVFFHDTAAVTAGIFLQSDNAAIGLYAPTSYVYLEAGASELIVSNGGGIQAYLETATSFTIYDSAFAEMFNTTEGVGGFATAPQPSADSALALGTAYQNTLGYDVLLTVTLAITANVSGVIELGVGPTATPTQSTIASGTTLTGFLPVQIYLPNNYYALLTATGTITATIAGQIAMPV